MRDKIKLISSEGNGHFYTTTKNKKTMPEKMEIKKLFPDLPDHVRLQYQLVLGQALITLLTI